jgi:hypothetical protein
MRKQSTVASVISAGLLLAAAAYADPYNPAERAIGGGLVGAGTGAVIGAIAGGGRGAGIGALVGGNGQTATSAACSRNGCSMSYLATGSAQSHHSFLVGKHVRRRSPEVHV